MTKELHRLVRVNAIPARGDTQVVTATPAEREALAARLGIPAVLDLTCRFRLIPGPAGTVEGRGELRARVVQICVVTLDEFEAPVAEDFAVRFVPAGTESEDIDPGEQEDEIPYAGGVIDLGEAAAEQLALALDPYPRKPGAELPAPDDPPDHPPGPLRQ